jgi:hypothetical protein
MEGIAWVILAVMLLALVGIVGYMIAMAVRSSKAAPPARGGWKGKGNWKHGGWKHGHDKRYRKRDGEWRGHRH